MRIGLQFSEPEGKISLEKLNAYTNAAQIALLRRLEHKGYSENLIDFEKSIAVSFKEEDDSLKIRFEVETDDIIDIGNLTAVEVDNEDN